MLDYAGRGKLEHLLDRICELRIAVTGHRRNRLNSFACKRVEDRFQELFSWINARSSDGVALDCGLAAGTDLAAARACPLGWTLNGILAMPEPAWLDCVEAESDVDAASFRRLAMERRVRLTVLPPPWPNYVGLAERLTSGCDLLLAVWDGLEGAAGGTSDVVRRATEAGRDVLVLSPEATDAWRLFRGEPDRRGACRQDDRPGPATT